MTWTTQRPTKAGWYWWRRPNHQPTIVEVYGPLQGLLFEMVRDVDGSMPVSSAWADTVWAGPLEPPTGGGEG